jgi:L-alanine-DL-glutamate epimerase-like enolase superfamily enzyme
VVEVALRCGDVVGHGEATPRNHYGETVAGTEAWLAEVQALLGEDPFAFDEVETRVASVEGPTAARAGLDAAMHDVCGKLTGLPSWRLLGLRAAGPATSMTIGLDDPDTMARRAVEWSESGFRRLKLKLGGGDGLDVERVRAVREASPLALQVDINEFWSLDEALESIPQLADLGVELVEQPLRAGDPAGLELRRRTTLPIYADEDCHTRADLAACAEIAHGINIKLAKCGGIREAIRMVHGARALGLGVMLGCMNESSLGIAAACAIASLADYVDLDTNLMLADDPWRGLQLRHGVQLPSLSPGLGVSRA